MSNTTHGPFVAGGTLSTGHYGTGGGQVNTYTSGNVNYDETQSAVALASFNPDLIGAAFVLSGVACVKDATTASQLNITAGEAYLVMTDGTTARMDITATNKSTTGNLSTTMYLDLNPDGSWSWGTSHSAQANYLPICQVTTDGSGNIASVTDKRVTQAQALVGATHTSAGQPGGLLLPAPLAIETTQSAVNAATVNGGVTFAQTGALAGSMDGAATFNGTTGYLLGASTGLPTGNAAFSLEGWFKTATTTANQFIVALGGTTAKTAGLLYVNSSNQLMGDLFSSSIHSTATVTNGAWHHAVFTWDGTNGNLYLDGALVAGPTALGPNAMTAASLYIGAQNFGSIGNFMNGALDEVAVYGAALSAARVTAHYNAGVSATSDGYASAVLADAPLRYYRLGDASGATTAVCTTSPTATTLVGPAGALFGALRVGNEGANTVMRTYPSAMPLIIQVNGLNFTLDAGGGLTVPGAVASVAGQATAGSFGAPVIVAQTVNQHVTTTSQTTILSFTPGVTGLYRVSGYFFMNNGSGSQKLLVNIAYQDPITNTAQFVFGNGSVGQTAYVYSGGFLGAGIPTGYGTINSSMIYAKAGTAIVVSYQDQGGTPNDWLSVMLERLS